LRARDFREQREAFSKFRKCVLKNEQLKKEIVQALTELITEYDAGDNENRFVIGGAVEHIIVSAMRASGIRVFNRGQRTVNHDIELPSGNGFSSKGTFQDRPSNIRIKNFLGAGKGYTWKTTTILTVSTVGIAYLDPAYLPGSLTNSGDASILKRKVWRPFLSSHPELLIALNIPPNPHNPSTKRASYTVAEEILIRQNFKLLRKFRTSVVED
jgi:hypothetical protein